MHNKLKTLVLTAALTTISGSVFAVTDSTMMFDKKIKPVVTAYLLDRGTAETHRATSQYDIKVKLKTHCDTLTTPVLSTSVKSVEVLGRAQAIQGVNNSLTLNPKTYTISGTVTAPLNVDPYDSGATVNWQVWCQPKKTA